jgi:hypothetical protein
MGIGTALVHRAEGMLADLECVTGLDPDPTRWSTVMTPTLLLTGSLSDPTSARLLEKVLPDTRTTVLPAWATTPKTQPR